MQNAAHSMTLKKLSLRLFGTLVFISTVLAAVSFLVAHRVHERSGRVTKMFDRVRLSEELQIHLLSTNREWHLYEITGDEEHERNRAHEEREVRLTITELKLLIGSDADRDMVDEVERTTEDYLTVRAELDKKNLDAILAYPKANSFLRAAHQKAAELTRINLERANQASLNSREGANLVTFVATAVLLLGFFLLPTAWMTIRRWVYRPIQNLRRGIDKFREVGQTDTIPLEGTKEIQEVAEAFNDLSSRLESQKKNRLRFLAGVAHDIKNPLSAIKMSTQILSDEDSTAKLRSEMTEIIARQTDHLTRMVGDFLDANRIEAGNLEMIKRPEDLRTAIRDSVVLHRQVSQRHEIIYDSEVQPVECNCDLTRITQVINNLLSNAIKYSPNGGTIKVSLQAEENQAVIHISDEGMGISQQDLETVFEPFRRTNVTKETIPGVGLGLSVSKHIVEAHGGTISIQSQPGQGSTFTICLPL